MNGYTTEEVLDGEMGMISAESARGFCEDHGVEFSELIADLGSHVNYRASSVLNWLGY